MEEENNMNLLERFCGKKPELVKEETYRVSSYPLPTDNTAKYLGSIGNDIARDHVFSTEEQMFMNELSNDKKYIFFDDHWIREINGVITYPNISSASVKILFKSKMSSVEESKLLKKLGEEI